MATDRGYEDASSHEGSAPANHDASTTDLLDGIVVVDASSFVSGPFCSMLLADLGATVIKVEHPVRGDGTRKWGPGSPGPNNSYYTSVNRNKQSVGIDLDTGEGKKVLHRLISSADVFIHNMRSEAAERLHIDRASLRALSPDLVYVDISGYGSSSKLPAFDFTIQAAVGLMDMTGTEGQPPVKVPFPIVDVLAAYTALSAVLASLVWRERVEGSDRVVKGRSIHITMTEAALCSMPNVVSAVLHDGQSPRRMGNSHPNIAPYEAFAASDGWVAVGAGTDRSWTTLASLLELEDLVDDSRFLTNPDRVRNREALVAVLSERFAKRTVKEWVDELRAADIPVSPVASLAEAIRQHAPLEHVEHEEHGVMEVIGSPYVVDGERCPIRRAPPLLGEDTDDVLSFFGNLTAREIDALRAAEVIS